jgi:hypothetical protein
MELSTPYEAISSAATGYLTACYWIQRFITTATRVVHLPLPWARPMRSTPHHPISPPFSLYLLTYKLIFLVVSFLLVWPQINYMHSYVPHLCYMPHPSHSRSLDHSHHTLQRVQIMQLLIMQFSSPPSLHPASIQTFSLAPCSQTPSAYVPPLMSDIKFHT